MALNVTKDGADLKAPLNLTLLHSRSFQGREKQVKNLEQCHLIALHDSECWLTIKDNERRPAVM